MQWSISILDHEGNKRERRDNKNVKERDKKVEFRNRRREAADMNRNNKKRVRQIRENSPNAKNKDTKPPTDKAAVTFSNTLHCNNSPSL